MTDPMILVWERLTKPRLRVFLAASAAGMYTSGGIAIGSAKTSQPKFPPIVTSWALRLCPVVCVLLHALGEAGHTESATQDCRGPHASRCCDYGEYPDSHI